MLCHCTAAAQKSLSEAGELMGCWGEDGEL